MHWEKNLKDCFSQQRLLSLCLFTAAFLSLRLYYLIQSAGFRSETRPTLNAEVTCTSFGLRFLSYKIQKEMNSSSEVASESEIL